MTHDGAPPPSPDLASLQLALAQRLVRGGLRLLPASDALWALAGEMAAWRGLRLRLEGAALEGAVAVEGSNATGAPAAAAATASAEFCLSRALALNPRRGATWALLARLYAATGRWLRGRGQRR
jgi:hypothetical protein